jgi:hypothetical protein
MLWQGIHFLNDPSPAAMSPATAAPAEDASATIANETLFIILRDPYSARASLFALILKLSRKSIRSEPSALCGRRPCVSERRETTTPRRDAKGAQTAFPVTAAQAAFSDKIHDFRRIS